MARRDIDALISCLSQMPVLVSVEFIGGSFEAVADAPPISEAAGAVGAAVPNLHLKPTRKPPPVPNPWEKTASTVQVDPGQVLLSRNAGLMGNVARALGANLKKNSAIAELRLVGVKIGKTGWNALGEGLSHGPPIEFLAVNYCKLDDSALEIIAPGLKKLERLRKLDLSNNQLADRCGFVLSRLISIHSYRKDEISWLHNLRNESASSDQLYGLQELCLANNKLSDHAVFDLCRSLSFDSWMLVLDLRRNPITSEGGKEICSMIESNCSLLVLDVRETGLSSRDEVHSIVKKLRRNLQNARRSLQPRKVEEYSAKIREIDGGEARTQHAESVSFPNVELTHEIREEDMIGSYLSESPKNAKNRQEQSSVCSHCRQVERQLLRSESHCVALKLANRSLRSSLRSRHSTTHASEEQDTRLRIESLMVELTQLIEQLEDHA